MGYDVYLDQLQRGVTRSLDPAIDTFEQTLRNLQELVDTPVETFQGGLDTPGAVSAFRGTANTLLDGRRKFLYSLEEFREALLSTIETYRRMEEDTEAGFRSMHD